MSKTAFVFPGQASQYSGMGLDLYKNFQVAKQTFEEADDVLNFSISKLCFEGSESDLQLTVNTQPAILVVSVATYRVLFELGFKPEYVVGHSLGEYSALVAAESISFVDAVCLVRKRGQYMQEAVAVGKGAMAAVIGSTTQLVAEICQQSSNEDSLCVIANFNSPTQIVIAGHREAVEQAVAEIKARKAGRAILLPVSAPFHSPLMNPAQEALKRDLEITTFKDPSISFISSVDVKLLETGSQVRDSLIRQLCAPVRWTELIQLLIAERVERFIEVGPKNVLSGLIKQIDKSLSIFNAENSDSVKTVAGLQS
ncbi:MAG: ACP S-malonyltransferase [Blastocatellia bacterium]|nr:ACP S-malonyltransferase [Blastocatellia bacterium]